MTHLIKYSKTFYHFEKKKQILGTRICGNASPFFPTDLKHFGIIPSVNSGVLTDERNRQQSGRGIPNPITAASGGITSPANKTRWRYYMDTLSLPLVSGI